MKHGKKVDYEVVIIGAGIAGSALGAYLGRNGFRVAVVERNWEEPEDIIGELLQPGGVLKLHEMGFTDATEGFEAQPVSGYALFLGKDHFSLRYPEKESPQSGFGFRYGRFVQKLRSYLHELPTVETIEGRAVGLLEENGQVIGLEYVSPGSTKKKTLHANLTIVSQGSTSNLRDKLSNGENKVVGYMLGLLLENGELPYPGNGHVFIHSKQPFLAYPVGPNLTRVLIDFPKSSPPRKGEELQRFLREEMAPDIPPGLRPAFLKELEEKQFRAKPTCQLAARPKRVKGAMLLGDSLNMRHPMTGGGMTVALTDVKALGERLIQLPDLSNPDELAECIDEFYEARHQENATMNILAYALYQVLCHEDLSQATFEYLKRGGQFASGPMSILAGVSRNRHFLLLHFVAVALHGMLHNLLPIPTVSGIKMSHSMLKDAFNIIDPLLRDEHPDLPTKVVLEIGRLLLSKRVDNVEVGFKQE